MKSFLALLLLAFAALPATAQESKIFPYEYAVRDLDNGLRVIVLPTDYPEIVSLYIPVSVGSRNEVEEGKSGFAHFFEHMMFRGTEAYPAAKYQALLKNAGADQNAYTTDDRTVYHTTFSKDDLETMMKLEADRFQNLAYSDADFRTEALAVLGEYNKNAANPISKLFEVQRAAAFDEHTYKHTTMGFIEDIEAMPDQFDYSRQFFDRFYRPGEHRHHRRWRCRARRRVQPRREVLGRLGAGDVRRRDPGGARARRRRLRARSVGDPDVAVGDGRLPRPGFVRRRRRGHARRRHHRELRLQPVLRPLPASSSWTSRRWTSSSPRSPTAGIRNSSRFSRA